jgi:hypothetical protein
MILLSINSKFFYKHVAFSFFARFMVHFNLPLFEIQPFLALNINILLHLYIDNARLKFPPLHFLIQGDFIF